MPRRFSASWHCRTARPLGNCRPHISRLPRTFHQQQTSLLNSTRTAPSLSVSHLSTRQLTFGILKLPSKNVARFLDRHGPHGSGVLHLGCLAGRHRLHPAAVRVAALVGPSHGHQWLQRRPALHVDVPLLLVHCVPGGCPDLRPGWLPGCWRLHQDPPVLPGPVRRGHPAVHPDDRHLPDHAVRHRQRWRPAPAPRAHHGCRLHHDRHRQLLPADRPGPVGRAHPCPRGGEQGQRRVS